MPEPENGVAPSPEDETTTLDFPDPHTWPLDESLWSKVIDAEVADRVLAVMRTSPVPSGHPGYEAAVRFLTSVAAQARADLGAALADHCHVPVPEETPSLFDRAGKARAFGADILAQPPT